MTLGGGGGCKCPKTYYLHVMCSAFPTRKREALSFSQQDTFFDRTSIYLLRESLVEKTMACEYYKPNSATIFARHSLACQNRSLKGRFSLTGPELKIRKISARSDGEFVGL
jgi:hypothetical protein